jgi:Zn-finger nucleic acid-binding protein
MGDTRIVKCAAGCDTTGPEETMDEIEGGMYQCKECTGAVIARGSLDEIVPREDTSLTRPMGDPDEAGHRGSSAA